MPELALILKLERCLISMWGLPGLRLQWGSPREPRESARIEDGIGVLLRPLIGVIGVDPVDNTQTSAILADPYAGNLVLRDFGVGALSDTSLKKLQRKAAMDENRMEATHLETKPSVRHPPSAQMR